MTNPRRRFLRWLGGSSLVGVAGIPAIARADGFSGDEELEALSDTFDMSWTKRVKGKHRAVFDSPAVSDGAALYRAAAWWDMYKEVYGTERKKMSAVVVLRHSAIPLVMGNAYWEKYETGKSLNMKDEKGEFVKANPVSTGGAVTTDADSQHRIENFLASGGIVLACNWAFQMIVSRVRREEKLDAEAAKVRAKELMIPGIILQPNGIFAALRAQEAGCSYVMGS